MLDRPEVAYKNPDSPKKPEPKALEKIYERLQTEIDEISGLINSIEMKLHQIYYVDELQDPIAQSIEVEQPISALYKFGTLIEFLSERRRKLEKCNDHLSKII